MIRSANIGVLLAALGSFSLSSYAQVAGSGMKQPTTTGSGAPSGSAADTQQPNETIGESSARDSRGSEATPESTVNSSGSQTATKRVVCTPEQKKKGEKNCRHKGSKAHK